MEKRSLRILFYERDEAFRSYVHQTILEKERAGGDNPQSDFIEPEIDLSKELDSVWYMFSHLLMMFRQLNSQYSTPTHVVCQNDFKLIMRQPMDDVLFFACISPDENGMHLPEIYTCSY